MNARAAEFIPPLHSERQMRQEYAFHYFNELNDELKLNILTFIVDAPFEESASVSGSTLTSVLPFVCHQFNLFCRSKDFLWSICMRRLIANERDIWAASIAEFTGSNLSSSNDFELLVKGCEKIETLIKLQEDMQVDRIYGSHGELFRYIFRNYILYESPLFYMPDNSIRIGRDFGIHFFEPRYRRLIRQVMAPYPEKFKRGEDITLENGLIGKPPTFIYAHKSPLKRGTVACVVQVTHCSIHQDGRADVALIPIHYVRVTQVYEEEHSRDHLYFCTSTRLTTQESNDIEESGLRSYAERIAQSTYATHGHGIDYSEYVALIFKSIQENEG